MNDLVRSSQLLCVGSNHSDPPVSMSLSSHSSMEEDGDQISSASDPSVSTTSSDYGNDDDEDFVDGDGDGDGDDGACNDANDQKSQNVDALVRGNLIVRRQSLLPRVLSVSDGAAVARKPFKPPCSKGYSDQNGQLTRRLWVRKRFVPWGSSKPALIDLTNRFIPFQATVKEDKEEDITLPPGVEPLVLWHPEECESGNDNLVPIVVDPLLVRFLRPHQREGVQFMFECVSGLHSADNIFGCILADDMGLGKTLQSIALLYTLLCQGFDGKPMVRKVIIVTPTSLVSNWEAEIGKWVGGRVQLIALCESSREDVISGIDHFTSPRSKIQVLIVSYETFRMHASKFRHDGSCDLLICDEAHRLKNDHTLTNQALAALTCKRRILLSGTPMQNDLEEFYAMVNFTNPGILGDATHFRRHYETPIICGREPAATEEEKTLGSSRSTELSAKVNQFILRRTNALLSNHLPPKIVEVVCCKLTPLQTELYKYIIHSKNVKNAITEEARHSIILPYITGLKKLCNHPKLIYDTIKGGSSGMSCFEGCLRFFPPELFSGRSGAWTGGDGIWVELSGKMCVLARLLAHLRQKTDDRIVLVSNYTQTLDLFAQLCRERRYPFLRLDGSTSISKRQKLVNRFNDPSKDEFVFLLSSKAGGCGLNLIGGNRLVLFDPDWNPANDKQAAARVWRDGQKKRVYIYRFLSTGTIEEKVYQRQMSKEGLQKVIQQNQADNTKGNFLSTEDLRDLFTFKEDVRSEIHEKMNCTRCERNLVTSSLCEDEEERHGVGRLGLVNGSDESVLDNSDIGGFATIAGCLHKLRYSERQVGTPLEEDLCNWSHHSSPTFVPDVIFQASAGDDVTFVFANQVDGKLVPVESMAPKSQDSEAKVNQSRLENMNGKSRILSKKPSLFSHGNVAMKTFSVPSKSKTDTTMNATRSSLSNTKRLSLLSPKLSLGSQLPLKRPPQFLEDDDFQ